MEAPLLLVCSWSPDLKQLSCTAVKRKALALLNLAWFTEVNRPGWELSKPISTVADVRFVCKCLEVKTTLNSQHVRIALDAQACLLLRQGLLHNPFLDSCMLTPKQTASYLMLNPAWICFLGPLSLPLFGQIHVRDRNKLRLSESMKISVCTPTIRVSCHLQLSVVNMECSTQTKWWLRASCRLSFSWC